MHTRSIASGRNLANASCGRRPRNGILRGVRLRNERGQAMVFILLCMTCLLGFVSFGVDVGILLRAKRAMQQAADAGAISGAAELKYGTWQSAAQAATAQNGVTNGSGGATVTVNNPPTNGPYTGLANYVEVIVTEPQSVFFMRIFNRSSVAVSGRAVATLGSNQGCIYTMGTSGTDLSVTGNANISVTQCSILDDSASKNAVDLTGNVTVSAQSIGVVGGVTQTGNVTVTPTPVTGIAPASNPLAFIPPPTVPSPCTNSVSLNGSRSQTIQQGCYSGISASGNTALTLAPGTYIINGPISITGNATLTGTNVTLDLLGSSNLTGNGILNLSAPTTGTYSGILIYQPSSNNNAISLVGNSGSTLEGTIDAPSAAVSFTGNSGSSIYTDFVVSSLTLTGNASFKSYAALAGSAPPLTAAKLVE